MDDLISRQTAIDSLHMHLMYRMGTDSNNDYDAALKMGIEALSCSEFPNSSDTISRQAAIDALDKRFDSIPMNQTTEILLLRKDLRELPSAQPEQRWIPCSERLPEFDTKVLAWVENKDPKGRFNSPGVYTAALRDKIPQHDPEGKRNFWGIPGYDSEWTVWSWSYFTEPDVKAWMPLPEPYKGGDTNE